MQAAAAAAVAASASHLLLPSLPALLLLQVAATCRARRGVSQAQEMQAGQRARVAGTGSEQAAPTRWRVSMVCCYCHKRGTLLSARLSKLLEAIRELGLLVGLPAGSIPQTRWPHRFGSSRGVWTVADRDAS